MMRVVFAGGGTGGHLFPGLAVQESLLAVSTGCECEFWGTGRPVETNILHKHNAPTRALPAAPVPGSPLGVPGFLYALWKGYISARRLLKFHNVQAVIGLGGYSSYAPVIAASRLSVATVVLEQNAVVGKANLHLTGRADLVCLSWEASRHWLPAGARFEVTGNPLRRTIVEAARRSTFNPAGAVVILGGSSGAVGLNTMVIEALGALGNLTGRIVHQTGRRDFERVRAAYEQAGIKARLAPFIDDIASVYSSASLVIARAGGTTLSETALFGIPLILVPYPHHKDYHQMANAEIFAQAGAAKIIEETPEGGQALASAVAGLLGDVEALSDMHSAALALGRADAADTVAARILEIVAARAGT